MVETVALPSLMLSSPTVKSGMAEGFWPGAEEAPPSEEKFHLPLWFSSRLMEGESMVSLVMCTWRWKSSGETSTPISSDLA